MGERRREHLRQAPGDARAAHEGQRPAAVDERLPVQVVLGHHDRGEQRRVRHVERDAEQPGAERHRVQLGQGQCVHRVADRDAGEQRGPAQVSGDHRLAAPRPGLAREGQVQPGHQPRSAGRSSGLTCRSKYSSRDFFAIVAGRTSRRVLFALAWTKRRLRSAREPYPCQYSTWPRCRTAAARVTPCAPPSTWPAGPTSWDSGGSGWPSTTTCPASPARRRPC